MCANILSGTQGPTRQSRSPPVSIFPGASPVLGRSPFPPETLAEAVGLMQSPCGAEAGGTPWSSGPWGYRAGGSWGHSELAQRGRYCYRVSPASATAGNSSNSASAPMTQLVGLSAEQADGTPSTKTENGQTAQAKHYTRRGRGAPPECTGDPP